jgi:hypothetical protein
MNMAPQPASTIKDKHYDLIAVLHTSQKLAWDLETYIADAENEGDAQLAKWFTLLQSTCRSIGETGRQLLAQRLAED